MKYITLIACCFFMLTGCATIPSTISKGRSLEKKVVLKDYEIGKEKTVSTGSVMIEKKEGLQQCFLTVTSAKGQPITGQWEFCLGDKVTQPAWYFNSPWRIENSGHLDAVKSYKNSTSNSVVFRITELDFWSMSYPTKGEPVPVNELELTEQIAEVGGIMHQLIYNGKRGSNIIAVTYREFSNNFARPAFYQELSYDLNESTNISFRSYVIKVIKATNNKISFIVEKE